MKFIIMTKTQIKYKDNIILMRNDTHHHINFKKNIMFDETGLENIDLNYELILFKNLLEKNIKSMIQKII